MEQMHRVIARRWYCGDAVGLGMMGMMMGQGMMGGTPWAGNGMMGQVFSTGWITTVLLWIFLIAGIAAFIRFLTKK